MYVCFSLGKPEISQWRNASVIDLLILICSHGLCLSLLRDVVKFDQIDWFGVMPLLCSFQCANPNIPDLHLYCTSWLYSFWILLIHVFMSTTYDYLWLFEFFLSFSNDDYWIFFAYFFADAIIINHCLTMLISEMTVFLCWNLLRA